MIYNFEYEISICIQHSGYTRPNDNCRSKCSTMHRSWKIALLTNAKCEGNQIKVSVESLNWFAHAER